jgi:acetylornithine deacetylase/succinyl-diaminopimelate desuccinylase-like protein
MSDRALLARDLASRGEAILAAARALIAAPSPNPPGDTRAAAEVAAALLREAAPEAEIVLDEAGEGVINVIARIAGGRPGPGRRVLLNGHLDTYPVLPDLPWTVDPLGGEVRDGKLYGRGAADMKGGIAASIAAFAALARHRGAWAGELALTLAGDEESMGVLGTKRLMDRMPGAGQDGVLIADAGSPRVLRFGEKGFLWFEVAATGRPAHGAHVHLGENAIDRLRRALDLLDGLRDLPLAPPPEVTAAIAAARTVSEPLSGAGEAEVLGSVTVNIGRIEGGVSTNLVPASARAFADIRLPVGASAAQAEAWIAARLGALPGISVRVLRRFEPNHTDPAHPLVRAVAAAAAEVLGAPPAVNMRIGGSDARWFRLAGMPTVVYGPAPHNMGGADEWVAVEELLAVARVQGLAAFDILAGP